MSDHDADREAIIALIHRNRIAIWMRDYDAYASCFVHADYMSRWNASPLHGIYVRAGWNEVSKSVRAMFDAGMHTLSRANAYDTAVENLMLRIHGDVAWATYNQRYPAPQQFLKGRGYTHEMRVFERHDGQWKIVFLGYLDEDLVRDDSPILQLDPEGRVIYQTTAATRTLQSDDDLVVRNGKLRVRDSRTDERLQSALRWAAGRNQGYLLSKASLSIVHDAGEGTPAKVWWIISEGGRIWFAFGDTGVTDERLSAAGAAFGLSPAQLDVARLIAEGRTLTQIADQLGITANTARTHLDRVFDKTGVRTQPALVRILLTVISPL